jgi:hypothetical protein
MEEEEEEEKKEEEEKGKEEGNLAIASFTNAMGSKGSVRGEVERSICCTKRNSLPSSAEGSRRTTIINSSLKSFRLYDG